MSNPTMSTKLVMMRTDSFPLVIAENLRRTPGILVGRFSESGRCDRASDDSGERDDRQQVGNHLDELRRYRVAALQLDLQCFRRSEQETGERGTNRIPSAEDHGRDRDEAAAGRHLIGELVLIEGEINPAETGENSRRRNREPADALDTHPDTLSRVRMVTCCSHSKSVRRAVNHECNEWSDQQP